MVIVESVVSGHKFNIIRPRLSDKLEIIAFDPYSKSCNQILPVGIDFYSDIIQSE